MKPCAESSGSAASRVHWPSLLAGVGVMLGITLYPLGVTHADGQAHHGMALLLCWAMAAGIVRGVGFVPYRRLLRGLLSGWACLGALVAALLLKLA